MVVAVYDETDRRPSGDVSDYLVSNLQDPLGRIQGVGDINVFGAQYAMRIWLDPVQARQLSADARRRHHRDPGAEHPGRRRPDRRPAGAAEPDARTRP